MTTHTLPFGGLLRRALAVAGAGGALAAAALAQPTSDSPLVAPPNGMRRADPSWHAIAGATIHTAPGQVIENGTVILRDGRITWVGPSAEGEVPAAVAVSDGAGLHIYAGLIEPYYEVGAPGVGEKAKGTHWNDRVEPRRRAGAADPLDASSREALRKLGFTAAHVCPSDGIFRGSSAVVSLADLPADEDADRPPLYAADVFDCLSFATAGRGGGYPSSHMGAVALIRQTFIDADWQAAAREAGERIEPNALDPLHERRTLLFDSDHELKTLQAAQIGEEFDREVVIVGNGEEYKRLNAIAADGRPLIVPLRFPGAPDVSTLARAEAVELETLMSWEQAPTNPRRLADRGLSVALTSSKSERRGDFLKSLRSAIEHGLAEDDALAMVTTTPASILGLEDQLGTVEAGKRANLVVASGPLFDKDTKIRSVWIDGREHVVEPAPRIEPAGVWSLHRSGVQEDTPATLTLDPDRKKATMEIDGEGEFQARNLKLDGNTVSFLIDDAQGDRAPLSMIFTAVVQGRTMTGWIRVAEGEVIAFRGERTGDLPEKGRRAAQRDDEQAPAEGEQPDPELAEQAREERQAREQAEKTPRDLAPGESPEQGEPEQVAERTQEREDEPESPEGTREAGEQKVDRDIAEIPEAYGTPFGPYGVDGIPPQEAVLIKNATIWTSGPMGIIENGFIYIAEGKVIEVMAVPANATIKWETEEGVRVIDARGRHVTPGLIDAHSHTGLFRFGVNEGTQASTAEVRIHDDLDPGHVNWYRQLAGGVTTVNSLHGSANPIGGQNAVHKVRWGAQRPADMLLEGAPSGIKFALGENVKQSNWGDRFTTRYPQTRMGVETYIRDRFLAAQEYDRHRADQVQYETWRTRMETDPGFEPKPEIVRFMEQHERRMPFRRDLELEALAEILAGERLIHCHSYRQDEILMLCRIAEEFGFTIGSFQHVLEGYKVAEAIRENALGASCFSDWWAYKVEVQDAIPYNGAIMHDAGVVVSFNSDSDELARRMNAEAAKAVKYDNVPPAEALKFVTLNPAIQLGIEDRVGSLEEGKDADLVIWSGDPLSTLSRCEATWIDGREYFSLEKDAELQRANAAERQRLIEKILRKGRKEGDGKQEDEKKGDNGDDEPGDPELRERMGRLIDEYLDNTHRESHDHRGSCGCDEEAILHQLLHHGG